jgi:uncharacterized protein YaiE (UPF0345 family)
MSTTALKHNSYFDGRVQSIGFERHGRRATAGVIAPGEYHFGTEAPERMTIVSGRLAMKAQRGDGNGEGEGEGDWTSYPAGTAFEVRGQSGFDVRATEPCAYLCEFL